MPPGRTYRAKNRHFWASPRRHYEEYITYASTMSMIAAYEGRCCHYRLFWMPSSATPQTVIITSSPVHHRLARAWLAKWWGCYAAEDISGWFQDEMSLRAAIPVIFVTSRSHHFPACWCTASNSISHHGILPPQCTPDFGCPENLVETASTVLS